MFCMKCGQVLEDGVRFCPVCGTAVEQAENPVNEAAEQAFAAGTEDMSYAPAEEAVQGAYAYGEQAAEEAASFEYGAEPEQPVYGAYDAGAAEAAYEYTEPVSGAAAEPVKKPKAVGSLVCGIIGLVLCWVPIVGAVLGLIGLILGIRAFKRGARGMAIAGIILSAIALVFGLIITIIMGIGIAAVVTGMSGSYGIPGLMELEDLINDMGGAGSGSYGGGYKMKAMMDLIARIK